MDQHKLVKDCLREKPAAQRQLYDLFAGPMLGVCYRYTKSMADAEDVLQEGFVKVFKNLHQFKAEGELGGWIRRIMITTAINYLKRNIKYGTELLFENEALHAVTTDNPELRMEAKALAELIRQLPPGYQTVFNLHAVEGYTHVEIGALLGINEGTSRSQYARARGLLISWIEKLNGEKKQLSMQENSFEKQVQQKMEELSFAPSAPVWQKVEAQIKKKREKRRLLLWLWPLLLAGGGLIWLYTNSNTSADAPGTATAAKTQKPLSTPITQKVPPAEPAPVPASIERPAFIKKENKVATAAAPPLSAINEQSTSGTIAATKNNNTRKRDVKSFEKRPVPSMPQETIATPGKKKIKNVASPIMSDAVVWGSVPAEKGIVNYTGSVALNDITQSRIALDSVITLSGNELIHGVMPAPVQLLPAHPWKWAVVARAGTSMPGKSLFDGVGTKLMREQLGSDPLNSPGGGSVSFAAPSEPTKGFSFTGGVTIKKGIGKNRFMVTGLQYSYYSTRLQVGTAIRDSFVVLSNNSVARYNVYRNNSSRKTLVNSFHLIEVPLGFEYRPFRRLPLQLQHGFNVGYLLASNAIHYDYGTNLYYKDNNQLHKTAVQVFTGIDYRIVSGKRISLSAGPMLQYSLRPLYKNATGNKSHLLTTGMQTHISF